MCERVESVSRDLENLSCNLKPSPPVSFPWILPSPINLAFLLLPHLLGREEGTVTEGPACSGQTPPGTSVPRTEALWAEAPPTPAAPPSSQARSRGLFLTHPAGRSTHLEGHLLIHEGAAPALLLPWGLGSQAGKQCPCLPASGDSAVVFGFGTPSTAIWGGFLAQLLRLGIPTWGVAW